VTAEALLVFARCAGFVFRAPGLSHPSVPHPLRAGIALLLAGAIAPSAHAVPCEGIELVVLVAVEFLIGSAIGFAASLLYDAAYAGGRMLDDYVGVKAIAPNIAVVAPSGFGRIWSIAFTGGYFLFGAYRLAIWGFARSFDRIPPGSPFDPHGWNVFALALGSTMAEVAVAVAAPAVALAFATQVALAALARTIPRFATFTLSFPLVFGVVLIATAISIPLLAHQAADPVMLFPGAAR
jgi:flagellar biosynthesis protein FliR